jgi:hypothetical protein
MAEGFSSVQGSADGIRSGRDERIRLLLAAGGILIELTLGSVDL